MSLYFGFMLSLTIALLAKSDSACLYNATHCQCSQGHEAGVCLHPQGSSLSPTTCTADPCSDVAYKCDCLGSSICPLNSCTKWKSSSSSSPATGSTVPCSSEEGVCVSDPVDSLSTPCVHNSTHCQCGPRYDGGLCLRFLSGSNSSATCVVEDCIPGGLKCDCMGHQMCELEKCGKWSSSSSLSSLTHEDMVPCYYLNRTSPGADYCPHDVDHI